MTPLVGPLHLGELHASGTVLLVLLAVGPFAVLGLVVAWRRRRQTDGE